MPQQPAAMTVLVQRDAAEVAAVNVRDPVMLGEALVEKRIVGLDADRARCGPRAGCSRRTAPFPAATPAAGCRRNRETDAYRELIESRLRR